VKFSKNEGEKSQTLFLTCNSFDAKHDFVWYLDSGFSNHMRGNKNMFLKLDESVKRRVNFGNDNKTEVRGKGTTYVTSLATYAKA
jgi:hypothetical protein